MEWQLISSAPQDGTEFQMFEWGVWSPRVKIKNGGIYSLECVTKNWESFMDWEFQTRFYEVETSNGIFWAPQPTDPFVKE